MLKFSSTGWNNVIIFAVMGFIVMINVIYQDETMMSPHQDDAQLLAKHSVILSLTINQQTNIERIGKTWRALPEVLSGQPLSAMMESWQQLSGELIEKPVKLNKMNMVIVSLVIAGQEQDQYFALFPEADSLVIFKQSTEQYFLLPSPLFRQLIPQEVIL